jgi:nuclear pore complex protein Nup50
MFKNNYLTLDVSVSPTRFVYQFSDCMVQNKDDVDTCPCCGATKPGAVPKKAAPAAATPASGFSFGYKPETTAAPSLATGTFAFGKPSESSSGGATGFTFGVKADASVPPTGFSFGAKPEATTTPASTFSFGAKSEGASTASSSPAVGFSFGVAKSSTPQQTSSPSLEKPAEAKSTSGKDSASTVSKGNSTEFCRRLKALNQQVSEWIKLHVDKDPLVILSPIFKDYEKHLHELESKYGGSAESASGSGIDRVAEIGKSDNKTEHKNSKPDETASSGFTFGSKSATPTTPAFSFGSAAKPSVEKPASEAAGGFSFGSGSQSTDSSKAGLFSFGSDSKAPKSTFSFGDSSAQKPASAAPFVFGDSAKASPATGFSFGAPGTSTPR